MDVSARVVEGLRKSSKGSLNYHYGVPNRGTSKGMAILDQYNSLPQLSPEIRDMLAQKVEHLSYSQSLSSSEDVDYSRPAEVEGVDQPVIGEVNCLSVEMLDLDESFEGLDESVVGELSRELEECKLSLDDELMRNSAAVVELSRKQFQQLQEDMRRQSQEKLELAVKDMHEQQLHQLEEQRLDEICRSLAIENWKHNTLQENRAEEERIEAMLLDGEQRVKKITMLREERKKDMCRHCRTECQVLEQEWVAIMRDCQYPQALPVAVVIEHRAATEKLAAIASSLATMEQLTPSISESQITVQQEHVQKLKPFSNFLRESVQKANLAGKEEVAREQQELLRRAMAEEEKNKLHQKEMQQKQELARKQELAQKQELARKQELAQKQDQVKNDKKSSDDTKAKDKLGMPKSAVLDYTKRQEMLSNTLSATSSFSDSKDATTKRYRFELQKAINITVNSVSANSGEGLIEKITRLSTLIGGRPVDVMGKQVDVSRHPEARLYCCNLLAKKVVKQGEDQVSSNMEAAFPLAAVTIGLWSKFPEIGEHILGHIHSSCPILVPLYVQKTSGMTEVDYMKLQGYKVSSDGVVETEDMFLHRIRGIVRLYAAIVSSPPPPAHHSQQHPHGLEYGWMWLARVLNMKPHPTLTAAALGDFLEEIVDVCTREGKSTVQAGVSMFYSTSPHKLLVFHKEHFELLDVAFFFSVAKIAGHALMKKYRQQFRKLLQLLYKEFVPQLNECTPASQRGPIARLTQTLEESRNMFSVPKGYLQPEFWRTRSKGIAYA